MDFYQVLAQYYDELFPLKDPAQSFLSGYLRRGNIKTLLDVGCGTGSHTLAAAAAGVKAVGFDLSEGMVEIAREKAAGAGSGVQFSVGNLLHLDRLSHSEDWPERFDGIFCLGNTLPHLTTPEELEAGLRQFACKGKHLLIQTVNYDRVLDQKITSLPEIRTDNLLFQRFYCLQPDGALEFIMKIFFVNEKVTGEKSGCEAVQRLYPWRTGEMQAALDCSGWQVKDHWGSYGGEDWNVASPASIIAAVRKDQD